MVRSIVPDGLRSSSPSSSDGREASLDPHSPPIRRSVDDIAFKYVRREIVALVVLSVMTAAGFVLTRAAAASVRTLRLRDAMEWYEMGERQLRDGRPHDAVVALRRAAAIDHDNRRYQLQWATALAADRQDDAATQVLLRLRETTPENPEVNVQLARLAARNGDLSEAIRHYENAVYGMWSADDGETRRALRIELIRYLLDHQQRARALSELLILSGNLPADAPAQIQAGRLFLETGEPARALQLFQRALQSDAKNPEAIAGAGEAAFAAHDYRTAQGYLHAAELSSGDLQRMRATTDFVLERDPMRPGLPLRERRARAVLNLARARQALEACDTPSAARRDIGRYDRQSLRAEAAMLEPLLGGAAPRRDSTDTIEQAQDLVYRIEQQVVARCGGSLLDRALLLIGSRDRDNRP